MKILYVYIIKYYTSFPMALESAAIYCLIYSFIIPSELSLSKIVSGSNQNVLTLTFIEILGPNKINVVKYLMKDSRVLQKHVFWVLTHHISYRSFNIMEVKYMKKKKNSTDFFLSLLHPLTKSHKCTLITYWHQIQIYSLNQIPDIKFWNRDLWKYSQVWNILFI